MDGRRKKKSYTEVKNVKDLKISAFKMNVVDQVFTPWLVPASQRVPVGKLVNWFFKHVLLGREVCSAQWSIVTPQGQVVSRAWWKDSTKQGGKDSRRARDSAANPQRLGAVSLHLLTLSYSSDFFINPLSKCFPLPHSTDINTILPFPSQQMLFQLCPLVVTFGIGQIHTEHFKLKDKPFFFIIILVN